MEGRLGEGPHIWQLTGLWEISFVTKKFSTGDSVHRNLD